MLLLININLLDQPLCLIVVVSVAMQLEGIAVEGPHVLDHDHTHQETFQSLQFEVSLPVIVRQDWNSIVELSCIGVGCIVDKHHILEISVDYS